MTLSFKRWLSRHIDSIWYQRKPVALLLLPLTGLFVLVVMLRRLMYRLGLKKSTRLSVPVIVVGNISVGGTGKTPFIIWLANNLKDKGFKPGIISRGYGGEASSWPQQVRPDSDPRTVGDEAVIISRQTGCPMAVGPDRVAAGEALLEHTDCDLILSDDGMQHYALQRTIEIAVIDGIRRFGNGYCLPAGPLREPRGRLKSVDLVVVNGGGASSAEVSMTLSGESVVNLKKPSRKLSLSDFKGQSVHAIAGIGNPGRFFSYLEKEGLQPDGHSFPDHHLFSAQDLSFGDDKAVLMTEKDAVKCRNFATGKEWFVPVEAKIDSKAAEIVAALVKERDQFV